MKKKISLLKKGELKKFLKQCNSWQLNAKETQVYKTFTFENHIDALVFIARVTVHAQVQDHHPDINFGFKKVKVTLTTHEVKGVTKKDFELISKIDSIITGG